MQDEQNLQENPEIPQESKLAEEPAPAEEPAQDAAEEQEIAEGQETEKLSRRELRKKKKKEKPKRPLWQEILSWVWPLLGALVIALIVRSVLFEPVKVDGSSMKDTLQDGEIMFVDKTGYSSFWVTWPWGTNEAKEASTKWTYFGNPARFDPVVCRYPDRGTTNFVKRVVGLPGDTVEMKDGYLYVNGEKYEEPYINDTYRAGENWGNSVQVPKKGDTVTFDGTNFLVNGETYSYDHAKVTLEGDITIRGLHPELRYTYVPFVGNYYLVKCGKESYVFAGGSWYHLVESLIYSPDNGDTSGYRISGTSRTRIKKDENVTLPTGSILATYYDNEQSPVQMVLEEISEAPIKEGDFTVAEDNFFVMGDHRNSSRDSRWVGAVPRSYIMGRVRQVIWPLNQWRGVQNGLEYKAE